MFNCEIISYEERFRVEPSGFLDISHHLKNIIPNSFDSIITCINQLVSQICYYSLKEQITRELDKENLTSGVFSEKYLTELNVQNIIAA